MNQKNIYDCIGAWGGRICGESPDVYFVKLRVGKRKIRLIHAVRSFIMGDISGNVTEEKLNVRMAETDSDSRG